MNDKDYAAMKSELDSIDIPQGALSLARGIGLQQARKVKRRRTRMIGTFVIATALILIFATTIRVSSVFADAVAKLPGFAPLVAMIAQDKGIDDILKNDYHEMLNISETKNDLTFTLLGVIADESGMIINYEVEAPYEIHDLSTKGVGIQQNNKGLEGSLSYGWYGKEPTKHIEEIIEVTYDENIDYTNPNFELIITFDAEPETTFNIPFSLQNNIAKSKYYPLNQTVEIDGQKFTLKTLRISPLRARLDIRVDPANTMQIIQLNNIKLLDEQGEIWGDIENGVNSFGDIREGEAAFFIQSNYFREPESLRLEISEVQALPKGEDYIEVDFLRKEVLYIPEVVDVDINVENGHTIRVGQKATNGDSFGQMFFGAVDADGEEVYENGFSHWREGRKELSTYTFDTGNKVNPIRIYFNAYDNVLDGSAVVEIPLN